MRPFSCLSTEGNGGGRRTTRLLLGWMKHHDADTHCSVHSQVKLSTVYRIRCTYWTKNAKFWCNSRQLEPMVLGLKGLLFKERKANPGEVEISFLYKMCCVWTYSVSHTSLWLIYPTFSWKHILIVLKYAWQMGPLVYLMKCPHSHLQVQATFIFVAG